MSKNIRVAKIEGEIIYLEFPNKTIKKYLKENFVKEPFIDQKVEILNNGLIIEKQVVPVKEKKPNKKLQFVSLVALTIHILVMFIKLILGNPLSEIYFMNLLINLYILATLFIFVLYTYYVNNKTLNILLKVLVFIPLVLLGLYTILEVLMLIWTIIACISCVGA